MTDLPAEEHQPEAPQPLAHELQFRLFEQMTTLGTAGAGLTITLIGSVLSEAGFLAWMAVIWFGAAALLSLSAQTSLTDTLFAGGNFRRRGRALAMTCSLLIGIGVGSLGASVALLGR